MADAILQQGKETRNDDDIALKKVRTPQTSRKDIDCLELKVNACLEQQAILGYGQSSYLCLLHGGLCST